MRRRLSMRLRRGPGRRGQGHGRAYDSGKEHHGGGDRENPPDRTAGPPPSHSLAAAGSMQALRRPQGRDARRPVSSLGRRRSGIVHEDQLFAHGTGRGRRGPDGARAGGPGPCGAGSGRRRPGRGGSWRWPRWPRSRLHVPPATLRPARSGRSDAVARSGRPPVGHRAQRLQGLLVTLDGVSFVGGPAPGHPSDDGTDHSDRSDHEDGGHPHHSSQSGARWVSRAHPLYQQGGGAAQTPKRSSLPYYRSSCSSIPSTSRSIRIRSRSESRLSLVESREPSSSLLGASTGETTLRRPALALPTRARTSSTGNSRAARHPFQDVLTGIRQQPDTADGLLATGLEVTPQGFGDLGPTRRVPPA